MEEYTCCCHKTKERSEEEYKKFSGKYKKYKQFKKDVESIGEKIEQLRQEKKEMDSYIEKIQKAQESKSFKEIDTMLDELYEMNGWKNNFASDTQKSLIDNIQRYVSQEKEAEKSREEEKIRKQQEEEEAKRQQELFDKMQKPDNSGKSNIDTEIDIQE